VENWDKLASLEKKSKVSVPGSGVGSQRKHSKENKKSKSPGFAAMEEELANRVAVQARPQFIQS